MQFKCRFCLICIAFFCGVQALAFIWVTFHSPNCCLGAAKINLSRRLKLLKKLHCPGQFQVATSPPTLQREESDKIYINNLYYTCCCSSARTFSSPLCTVVFEQFVVLGVFRRTLCSAFCLLLFLLHAFQPTTQQPRSQCGSKKAKTKTKIQCLQFKVRTSVLSSILLTIDSSIVGKRYLKNQSHKLKSLLHSSTN